MEAFREHFNEENIQLFKLLRYFLLFLVNFTNERNGKTHVG